MRDFLLQHRGHQIRHGPHTFTDLCFATQTARQAHQNVILFVGLYPRAALHIAFAQHGTRLHRGVHFIARAVKEAGVDKCHAARRCGNTSLQVHAGATLFVHDAELDGAVGQAQNFFNTAEQLGGKCHFSRPMHFGFHDIDRPSARVTNTVFAMAFEVVQSDSRGDHGIQNAFWNFVGGAVFVGVQNRRVGHQVANIA